MRCVLLLWLALVATPLGAQSVFDASVIHQWTGLNINPLKNPDDPAQIRKVLGAFTILPVDVSVELAEKVIAGKDGRPGTICVGDTLPGMSFGDAIIWNGTVHVAWKGAPRRCAATTEYDVTRSSPSGQQTTYTAMRVHACKNLAPRWPTTASPPPVAGPDYSGIPTVVCPPKNGVPQTCC